MGYGLLVESHPCCHNNAGNAELVKVEKFFTWVKKILNKYSG